MLLTACHAPPVVLNARMLTLWEGCLQSMWHCPPNTRSCPCTVPRVPVGVGVGVAMVRSVPGGGGVVSYTVTEARGRCNPQFGAVLGSRVPVGGGGAGLAGPAELSAWRVTLPKPATPVRGEGGDWVSPLPQNLGTTKNGVVGESDSAGPSSGPAR